MKSPYIPEQILDNLPDHEIQFNRPTVDPQRPGADVPLTRELTLEKEGLFLINAATDARDADANVELRIAPGRVPRATDAVQRVIDLVLSVSCLLLLLPLFLLIAVAIKLDSSGSVLFTQERVGYRGASFRLYKFRSMVRDAELKQAELWSENERDGPVFKIRNDPRVTRVGQFLRKYSLDELPQLLNVVRGEMSLVGPRPALPLEVAMYTPKQSERLSVVPGITGLWQISGRADVSFEQSIELDLQYIRSRSIRLNLRIMLLTIPKVLKGEGAY